MISLSAWSWCCCYKMLLRWILATLKLVKIWSKDSKISFLTGLNFVNRYFIVLIVVIAYGKNIISTHSDSDLGACMNNLLDIWGTRDALIFRQVTTYTRLLCVTRHVHIYTHRHDTLLTKSTRKYESRQRIHVVKIYFSSAAGSLSEWVHARVKKTKNFSVLL